ncbi:MAG: DUF4363 family protein [Oscillospiraceae bacterium]|nr:DUF4363 family protein [Oscillospiraceae bacterium]
MNRFIISIVLLATLLVVSIVANRYVDKHTQEMVERMEAIRLLVEDENYDEALKATDEFNTEWQRISGNSFFIIDNGNIIEITTVIARTSSLIRQKNKDAVTECDSVISLLRLYKNKNQILLKDIL